MFKPNLVETTKRSGIFFTCTFTTRAPVPYETFPRSNNCGPGVLSVKGTPPGTLVIVTETEPALCACMFNAVGEVRLGVLGVLCCAHPSPTREEPITNSDKM